MSERVRQLITSLGVDQCQAEGGVGLILGMVKDEPGGSDLSQLTDLVPESGQWAEQATPGGMGMVASMPGGSGLGEVVELARGCSGPGMDAGMPGQLLAVITGLLEGPGGG